MRLPVTALSLGLSSGSGAYRVFSLFCVLFSRYTLPGIDGAAVLVSPLSKLGGGREAWFWVKLGSSIDAELFAKLASFMVTTRRSSDSRHELLSRETRGKMIITFCELPQGIASWRYAQESAMIRRAQSPEWLHRLAIELGLLIKLRLDYPTSLRQWRGHRL